MAKETKFALLIGLAIIVAFGFILARQDESARAQNDQRVPPSPQPVLGDVPAAAASGSVWSRSDGEDRLVQALQLGHDAGALSAPAPAPAAGDADAHAGGGPQAINITGIGEPPAGGPPAPGPAGVLPPLGPGPAPAPQQTWYTVEQGDNLTKIARKFYGDANADKWHLILEANPTRIPSPEGLRPRVRIIIPPLTGQTVPAGAPSAVPTPGVPAPSAVAVRTYEVKAGDTLSSIAERFLGSTARYQQIVDWNRDQIQDANSIRPGMKLKVGPAPAGPTAPAARVPLIVGSAPVDTAAVVPAGGSRLHLPTGSPPDTPLGRRMAALQPVVMRMAALASSLTEGQRQALIGRDVSLRDMRSHLAVVFQSLGATPSEAADLLALSDDLGFPWQQLAAAERPGMTAEQRREQMGRVVAQSLPTMMQRLGAPDGQRQMLAEMFRGMAASQPDATYVPIPESTVTAGALRRLSDSPAGAAPPAPAASQAAQLYVVQQGDTLIGIARTKLGSAGRWEELLAWNRDVISDPRYLRPGMKLRLTPPAGLHRTAAESGTFTSAPARAADVGEIVG